MWPSDAPELAREQERLASTRVPLWTPPAGAVRVGACAVVFGRADRDGHGWAAAVVEVAGEIVAAASCVAPVTAAFSPGELALREGPILESAVRGLPSLPDVLLVAAAGRDHPRRAGLALHLGAALDLPTVGVTDDPLVATGAAPDEPWSSRAPIRLDGEIVGYRVRTRGGVKPVVAHAAWRTSADVAADIVLGSCALARWPEPMREARRIARAMRDSGRRRT